ncbi:hypothetical protein ACP26L_06810 [Paenibacillus sp. S-38]
MSGSGSDRMLEMAVAGLKVDCMRVGNRVGRETSAARLQVLQKGVGV